MPKKCPKGKIWRDAYTRQDGTHVKGTCVPDKGKPGKTPASEKWSPKIKTGALRGWSKNLPADKRHEILKGVVKDDSYATTIRRLNWLKNITDDQATIDKAQVDIKYLQQTYRAPKVLPGKDTIVPIAIIAGCAILLAAALKNRPDYYNPDYMQKSFRN